MEVFVCGCGGEACRVDEFEGFAGGIPACTFEYWLLENIIVPGVTYVRNGQGDSYSTFVVEHNCQDRNSISRRNPINATRDAEKESPIPNDRTHELRMPTRLKCQSYTQRCSTTPPQSRATTIDPAAGEGSLKLIGDRNSGRDCFNHIDSVWRD